MGRKNILKSHLYIVVAVGLLGILKGKQKLGATFNFDKLGGIDLTKFSKLNMCRASKPEKLTLLKIKYIKFSPNNKFHY